MTPNISLLSKNSGSYTYNLLSNRLFLNAGRKCDNYVKLMYIGVQSGGEATFPSPSLVGFLLRI